MLLFRQLCKTALCTLDLQLIEIPNGEVEEHTSGDVSIPGRLKEAIGSQLVTAGLETSALVKSGRTQIMLDQPEKTRAQRIVRQQLEQAADGARLISIHQLERSTMGILGPEHGMISEDLPSPGRIIELSGVRNPRELDLETPANHLRDLVKGTMDQSMRRLRLRISAPAIFVEDENRRFGESSWRDVDLPFFGQLRPDPRPIVEGIEPTDESLTLPGWYCSDGPPCAADIAH